MIFIFGSQIANSEVFTHAERADVGSWNGYEYIRHLPVSGVDAIGVLRVVRVYHLECRRMRSFDGFHAVEYVVRVFGYGG